MRMFAGPIGHIVSTAAIGVFFTWLATPHGLGWVAAVWLIVPTITLMVYGRMARNETATREDVR